MNCPIGDAMQTRTIRVGGMTCVNCQNRITKKLKSLAGVEGAVVDYAAGTAKVTYDEAAIDLASNTGVIESLGYTTPKENRGEKTALFNGTALEIIGVLAIILTLAFLLRAFSTSSVAASFPLAEAGMGYGMLFVIGLLTSVHCIAMCGGINLSQSLAGTKEEGLGTGAANELARGLGSDVRKHSGLLTRKDSKQQPRFPGPDIYSLLPGVLYNAGRLVSYTAVGITVGALGSVIVVSDLFRNIVLLLAGLLMLIMGINMLGLFPGLRRFTPRLPQFLTKKIDGQKAGRGPFIIGFLNGFMPCGPLQAVQLYALSTGNPIRGGLSMFLFCAGTIPLMFALGAAGGILSGVKGRAFSQRAIQVGAILVAAMGVVMFTNGLSGTGFAGPLGRTAFDSSVSTGTENKASQPPIDSNVQIIHSTLNARSYPAITVRQGIPVRWVIYAPQGSITGCNYRFIVREYGIVHTFTPGDNVIEFMPEKTGRFSYSCWMGMIFGTINVSAAAEDTSSG
jgi:sulfite exporter TauE/SafE/copper chaperone CopZ